MIKNVLKQLFSMTSMGVLIVILAIAMGSATFIENGSGITAAKALIYNARWFELAILLTFLNIFYNIFKYKLYVLKKLPVFLFHLSFLVIILGAGLTRYIGSEGSMHIREGETSNTISSFNTYFYVEMEKDGERVMEKQSVLLSGRSKRQVHLKVEAFGNHLKFKSTDYVPGAVMAAQMNSSMANSGQPDVLRLKVKVNGSNEEILLRGFLNRPLIPYDFELGGVKFTAGLGTMESKLPFSLRLIDFQLDRYPGSNSPSSFASEVMLIDKENNLQEPHRIFMNNILEHRGYRFYQSSYDANDEKGTVLSVNHDKIGTSVTYLGYFLMIITIIAALFTRHGRFGALVKATRKGAMALIAVLLFMGFSAAYSQDATTGKELDQAEVKAFGKLWAQGSEGRFMPLNTVAQDIVKKINKSNKYQSMLPEEFWLRILMNPVYWEQQPIFKIESSEIAAKLGLNSPKVSFSAFINGEQYILSGMVNVAYAKKPNLRTGTDKAVIKLDEKLNVFYMAVNGGLLKIFPDPADSHIKWYDLQSKPKGLPAMDSLFVASSFQQYLVALQSGNAPEAQKWREAIASYQEKYGSEVIPSDKKATLEVLYNKILVFERLAPFYATIGLILLIIQFMVMFRPKKWQLKVSWIFTGLLFLGFLFHTVGLSIRWYVSGHAPMSNGYESMIFVAWGALLAGFMVVRRSQMAMALTAILAAVALLVAHLSWMSPEITNLVPVLKSIWLTIHVAVIMTSYSFLGLGALIGLVVLVLYILKTNVNRFTIDKHILHLTNINKVVVIVGLYLITIGCFLGAIWANEAWGRYWGWDAKETWCLVSILVYTFVGHMHNIKGLNSPFSFNLGSLLGFSSILMTYFGVNYFLSASMHSYAAGDTPAVPIGAYVAVMVVLVLMYWAYFNQQRMSKLPPE